MRNRWNLLLFASISALTVFSILVVWPGWPKRYLPDFIDYPQGPLLDIGPDAMKLGLDVGGGSYVLVEANVSSLPPGTDVDAAIEGAKDVIERRVNRFGVSETEVSREGKTRLSVQVPGISPEEASRLISAAAILEFREPVRNEQGEVICIDATGAEFAVPAAGAGGGDCTSTDGRTGTARWIPATGTDSEGRVRALTGRFLKANGADSVAGGSSQCLPACVTLDFTGEGDRLFSNITGRLVGYPLAIFLDAELISAPTVQQQISGDAVITTTSVDEAKDLAKLLNAGALPVPFREISKFEVDPTLGETVLIKSVQAGLIGILAVMAFMIFYYRLPGILASLALITYASVAMMVFKTGLGILDPLTITLAGIAGFVLSVGMAVDANVLVFERMKEELRAGRALPAAIEHGFDRAWSSIRDSNISTLITCAILWWFGDQFDADLVKSFALSLGIGVGVSMFSAIIVTRTLLRLLVGTPLARNMNLFAPDLSFAAGVSRATAAAPFVFDFVRRRGLYFLLSGAILVPGIISLAVPPALKAGIEFSSGATITVVFDDPNVTQEAVHNALAGLGHAEARVQKTSGDSFIIRLGELKGPVGPPVGAAPPSERDQIEAGLEAALGPFKTTNFNQVSAIVSREIARNAGIAVGVAAIAILLYISVSFRNVPKAYRYGIAAVVAALHDALFILGAFSIFGKLFGTEINSMFITGVLTVIGFSVHDTIVVFDRIRENVSHNPGVPFDEVVNTSLTETVARSINTSTTVVLTLVALLLLGGGSINVLLLTLLLGIIAGTYSSIFIASQILVSWEDGDFARIWRRIWPRRAVPAEAPQS